MASRDAERPNVIVIVSDDQGYWAMGCAGNPEVRTPHLDALAQTGIRFENMFCTSPVCSPARASLLTGRIPSQHGVHDWLRAGNSAIETERGGELVEYLVGQAGYSDVLSRRGYVCGISGKWHLGNAHQPQKGFAFWEVHAKGGGPYYGAPMIRHGQVYREPRYVTDAITDHALDFLSMQTANPEPFYLSVHYTAPHSPWAREQHPADLYDAYFNACAFASLPAGPIHPWQVTGLISTDGANRREILSGYFAAVTAMDAGIGRILGRLERLNLRENTLIFFTGDNGMSMGQHGIYGKGNGTYPLNLYDTAVKVPAIMSRPGHLPQGRTEAGLFSHYDFMPTLLDYLGMPDDLPAGLPGRSFAGVLRWAPDAGSDAVVVYDEYGPARMIRTREWKYIHRYPAGPHELYDLAADPEEMVDLIADPTRQDILWELRGQMEEWFHAHVNPDLDGALLPITGSGQLGPAAPRATGQQNFAPVPTLLADGWAPLVGIQ